MALWVYGALLARSACESRVVTELQMAGARPAALRQALREWLRDGADKCAPGASEIDVAAALPALAGWAVSLWRGRELVLAIDATQRGRQLTSLVVSLLYRSRAAPLGWVVHPLTASYIPALETLLGTLAPALPRRRRPIVLTDRGLWSPRLWQAVRAAGCHPLMRVKQEIRVAVGPRQWCAAQRLVQRPGHAWVGRAVWCRRSGSGGCGRRWSSSGRSGTTSRGCC